MWQICWTEKHEYLPAATNFQNADGLFFYYVIRGLEQFQQKLCVLSCNNYHNSHVFFLYFIKKN